MTAVLPPIAHLAVGSSETTSGWFALLELHAGLRALDHDSRVVCREGSVLHDLLRERSLAHYAMPLLGRHDVLSAHRIGRWAKREGVIVHAHSGAALDLARWVGRAAGTLRLVASVAVGSARSAVLRDPRVALHVVNSRSACADLVEIGVPPANVAVVPRGIDLRRFDDLEPDWAWRSSLRAAPGALVVGCAPHVAAGARDLPLVLRAFARWRSGGGGGRLVVMGPASAAAGWSALAREAGVEEAIDLVDHEHDVLPRLAALDIFVECGGRDPDDLTALAALACGRPVIVARGSHAEDWIEPDRSGVLVERKDELAVADALGALQSSAARRQSLGHHAREHVRNFDLRSRIEGTARAYARLLGATAARRSSAESP